MTETRTARDELARIVEDTYEANFTVDEDGYPSSNAPTIVADTILDAGWRKPRTVTTAEELAPMPDGTVIIGPDGFVGEKRDFPLDLAVRYVNGTTETNHDIPMPALILWTPGGEQ